MNREPSLYRVDRLELTFAPKPWAFAIERRGDIDAYFAKLQREKPAVWNGRVLVLHSQVVSGGVFRGAFLETDYASFSAWRHWGCPPAGVHDCFSAAAVVSGDGAVLLGVMGAHTFGAGLVYFPCGTPDPGDIVDGKVDLGFSALREFKEETGCDAAEFIAEPGWTTIVDGAAIVHIMTLRSSQSADVLRARILAHLASEAQPELADIRIVRGPDDFDPMMPGFVTAFLARHFASG